MIKAEDGFTLMETLVALFVFALLTSAGTFAMLQTFDIRDRVSENHKNIADLNTLHSFLKRDLAQIVRRSRRDAFGVKNSDVFVGGDGFDSQLLMFVANGAGNVGAFEDRSSLETVEYLYDNGQIIRRSFRQIDQVVDASPHDRVLINGVERLDLSYFTGGQWVPSLTVQSIQGQLPSVVDVTVHFQDGRTVRQLFKVALSS